MERLATVVKDIPWEDQNESTYSAITYQLCLLSGTEAMPEHHFYKGRSDLEVLTPDYVYVFEFKFNISPSYISPISHLLCSLAPLLEV